jgi:hypothetical protein
MKTFNITKRYFSISKIDSASLESTKIARQRVGVFVRRGKKEKIEKAIRSIVFTKTKIQTSLVNPKVSKRASVF